MAETAVLYKSKIAFMSLLDKDKSPKASVQALSASGVPKPLKSAYCLLIIVYTLVFTISGNET